MTVLDRHAVDPSALDPSVSDSFVPDLSVLDRDAGVDPTIEKNLLDDTSQDHANHDDASQDGAGHDSNVVSLDTPLPASETNGTRERAAQIAATLVDCPADRAQELRDELVLLHLDAAEAVARRYRGRGQDHQDLVQVARLGLVEAANRYDPALGPFLGFAYPTMLGVVRRHFRDRAWVVKLPRSTQEHSALMSRAREELAHSLMRWPTTAELAHHLSLSEDEVRLAKSAAGCFQVSSLDAPAGERSESLAGTLAEDEQGFEQIESEVAAREACRNLDDRDRRLVHLRFYCQLSQRQIAAEFGVSQMQVSRWLARLTAQLRRNLLDREAC